MKKCAVLSVGQEILFGFTLDTNAAFFCNEMRMMGIEVVEMRTVNDGLNDIVSAIKELSQISDVIMLTGGLGPTPDDLTRQAIAEAAGSKLVMNNDLLKKIESYFVSINRPMVDSNKVQAMIPEAGTYLNNGCGTAPGVKCKVGDSIVYAMPGVPNEMKAMFSESIKPELIQLGGNPNYFLKRMHLCGLGESTVGDYLKILRKKYPALEIGTTVDHYVVTVRVSGADMETAAVAADLVKEKFVGHIFGEDGCLLEEAIVNSLLGKKATLALAESCTGGIIASELVGVSGASAALLEGVVSYSNQSKIDTLGVDKVLIEKYGAVSARCAKAMAEGVREKTGADYSLAVTGIAGPDGGTEEKPVGTVFFAISTAEKTFVFRRMFPQSQRNTTRIFASHFTMDVLRRVINNIEFCEEVELES